MKYKDFYTHLLLLEMPEETEYGQDTIKLDDPSENKKWTDFAKKEGVNGQTIVVGGVGYIMYIVSQPESDGKTSKSYYFLNQEQTEILANGNFKEYTEKGKLIGQIAFLWKSQKIKGFMKDWFKTSIVKQYDVINSNNYITREGLNFWMWILLSFGAKGMKVFILDQSNNSKKQATTPNDLQRGYGNKNVRYSLEIKK